MTERTEQTSDRTVTFRNCRDYVLARNNIDRIIRDTGPKAKTELETLAKIRTKLYLNLVDQWLMDYYEYIPEFLDASIEYQYLPYRMAEAFRLYTRFAFQYRYLEENAKNILFRKIFSFSLYYFHVCQVFDIPRKSAGSPSSDPDVALFNSSPLGHFCFYWLQKEYHMTPRKDLTGNKMHAVYDKLLSECRSAMQEFFHNHRNNEIGPDSFRDYVAKHATPEFRSIMDRIEKRGLRMVI